MSGLTAGQIKRLRAKAQAERDRNGFGLTAEQNATWLIYFWQHKAVSMGCELSPPDRWEPGVLAVAADGAVHRSAGGDADRGAKRWEVVS